MEPLNCSLCLPFIGSNTVGDLALTQTCFSHVKLVSIRTRKQRGLYQNKVTSSLSAIQRPGHCAENCKMVWVLAWQCENRSAMHYKKWRTALWLNARHSRKENDVPLLCILSMLLFTHCTPSTATKEMFARLRISSTNFAGDALNCWFLCNIIFKSLGLWQLAENYILISYICLQYFVICKQISKSWNVNEKKKTINAFISLLGYN